MNIQYVRSSSYNTYNDCAWKYTLEYLFQLRSPAGKKAYLGTIIHHCMELLARCSKTKHHNQPEFELFSDYKYLLRICWDRYIKENTSKFNLTVQDYMFCLTTIETLLASRFNPLKLNVLDVEKRFRIPIQLPEFQFEYFDIIKKTQKKGWYELRGTVDLVTKRDNETLEIIDLKTGRRKDWITGKEKTWEDFATKDIQLRMYDLATSYLYPQYSTRMMTMYYPNDGGPFTVIFNDDDRKETLDILLKHFNTVSGDILPERIKEAKPEQKWKCEKVCHFGITKDSNGQSICDRVYNYMLHHSLDKTHLAVVDKKKQKQAQKAKTSERRNIY